ncbi:hypothetical protein MBRA_03234 [Methylobacterium brachiatum]|nr:hypothetical protein MBRA_03234 [Methylobacterium brachiatum]
MQHEPSREPEELESHLLGLIESAREQAREDPFRNPVLAVTLAITRRFDRNEIAAGDLDGLFVRLRAAALAARAERLRAYVGLESGPADPQAAIPARLVAAAPAARTGSPPSRPSSTAPPSRWCSPRTRPSACRKPWRASSPRPRACPMPGAGPT